MIFFTRLSGRFTRCRHTLHLGSNVLDYLRWCTSGLALFMFFPPVRQHILRTVRCLFGHNDLGLDRLTGGIIRNDFLNNNRWCSSDIVRFDHFRFKRNLGTDRFRRCRFRGHRSIILFGRLGNHLPCRFAGLLRCRCRCWRLAVQDTADCPDFLLGHAAFFNRFGNFIKFLNGQIVSITRQLFFRFLPQLPDRFEEVFFFRLIHIYISQSVSCSVRFSPAKSCPDCHPFLTPGSSNFLSPLCHFCSK